ncbi:hypothetical protein [Pseudomonas sp. RA_35y_Pfl2_P32]|uniref:hypothetical protein n=1 Tax=Pseudomonas sp. RA_35y_Pfl2_P32 TaxID=3088705 RepID=UPI0030D7FBA9
MLANTFNEGVHFVGASLLAMDVNDDTGIQDERGALWIIASKLAPTVNVFKPQCVNDTKPRGSEPGGAPLARDGRQR